VFNNIGEVSVDSLRKGIRVRMNDSQTAMKRDRPGGLTQLKKKKGLSAVKESRYSGGKSSA